MLPFIFRRSAPVHTVRWTCTLALLLGVPSGTLVHAQLVDHTLAPSLAGEGIAKSYTDQIGADRGDWFTPDSSSFIITRDPFRAIRRGRQIFQRKFTAPQGAG